MFPKKIKVLGEKWNIEIKDIDDECFETEDIGGYCDPYLKTISIRDYREDEHDTKGFKVMQTILRHELVHALLAECGLWSNTLIAETSWSLNEEMIDWISFNVSKLIKLYKKCNCI